MFSHLLERTVNAVKARSPVTGHLLNLPLELRDIIYGMLLTSPYCTDLNSFGSAIRFHFHSAILLVNKQISAEATKIFYQGNDFVLLKIIGIELPLWKVPAFRLLSESKITSPVLRIEFIAAYTSHVEVGNCQSLITTPEGLKFIMRALWGGVQKEADSDFPDEWIRHGDSRLTLDFNPKAASRYQVLSELVLRPWDQVNVKELVLKGDIKEPMREHLMKSNMEGPFPNDVAAHFEAYNFIAEKEFERGNYGAAQWWWVLLNHYWFYVSRLRPCYLGGTRKSKKDEELCNVLEKSRYMTSEGLLMLTKACLRQLKYSEAVTYAYHAIYHPEVDRWEFRRFGPKLNATMDMKLHLSGALACVALGSTQCGRRNVKAAARAIMDSRGSRSLNMANMHYEELFKDLKMTIDNELICLQSLWRCDRNHGKPLSSRQGSGPEWQVGVIQRSFWEWMELPEERDVAPET
jgi:hypothetical protein